MEQSSSSSGPQHYDSNVTVRTEYNADGQVSRLTAENPATGDQVTQYVYGTTLMDSDIARSDLLRAEIYPDSDDTADPLGDGPDEIYDRIEYRYNRQGDPKEKKDQNETVHVYEFDGVGRQLHDRVTQLGAGVDGAVRRISTTYEVRGLVGSVTTHDNPVVGAGNIVNEVFNEYNDLGMLVRQYQEHDGAKHETTLYVGYNYDETAVDGEFTKGLRQTSLRYPNGRLVHYTYGDPGSMADSLNRLDAICDEDDGQPGMVLASYTYLGLGTVVIQDYEEPQIRLDLFGGASGTYAGFDRFDRVIDHRWLNYDTNTDVDRSSYGYDRASNRIWKENTVSKAQTTPIYLDEFYSHDGLHRLKTFRRGELNATKTDITGTPSREVDWTLDAVGNWLAYVQKMDGSMDLSQQRAANRVNEITDISESGGLSWVTPAYDKNGNMTVIPQPEDPTDFFICTYDAWNHVVHVEGDSLALAIYGYDGLNRAVRKAMGSETRHFTYTDDWQVIVERTDVSTNPDAVFIWGTRYIDHLVLRDRDISIPPLIAFDTRVYALEDANWNITSIADNTGGVHDRYSYHVYGNPSFFDPTYGTRSSSSVIWDILFAGYRWCNTTALFEVRKRSLHPQLGGWL